MPDAAVTGIFKVDRAVKSKTPPLAALAATMLLSLTAGAVGAADPATARAWLDGVEARLIAASGRAARLVPPPGHEDAFDVDDGPVFLIHAPLSTVWILDAETVADAGKAGVVDTATLRREESGNGGSLRVIWRDGPAADFDWPLPLPEFRVSAERHPLAEFHDRLLSKPLGSPLGDLPAGSRFVPVVVSGPGGIVERLDNPARVTLWESLGDRIAVTHPDGVRSVHGWREVDAALEGGAE